MFFYLIIFCTFILSICAVIKTRQRKYLYTPAILIYCFLISTKGTSGSDGAIYFSYFNDQAALSTAFIEPGFYAISSVLHALDLPFDFINIIHAIIAFFSLRNLSRKNPIITAIYIVFFGINIDFATIRQAFAFHIFSILLESNRMPFAKKFSPFFAATFHLSAIATSVASLRAKKVFLILAPIFIGLGAYYIPRYLDYTEYLVRSDANFILQAILVYALLYSINCSRKIIGLMVGLFLIPIGFRFAVYALPFISDAKSRNKYIAIFLILIAGTLKTSSFVEQSVKNDGEKGTVMHFQEMFGT